MEFLAKGKRGVVYTTVIDDKKVAVKVKNDDAEVNRLFIEAKFLKLLNKHGIGPTFLKFEENKLYYFFVEGEPILSFLENHPTRIKEVLLNVFNQCKIMDDLGIKKEEMHHPVKHILIKNKPVMIDFERCKFTEKPHNVTQFVQFITGSRVEEILVREDMKLDNIRLRELAKDYRKDPNTVYKKIIQEIK